MGYGSAGKKKEVLRKGERRSRKGASLIEIQNEMNCISEWKQRTGRGDEIQNIRTERVEEE
jgi:hypothetical protein